MLAAAAHGRVEPEGRGDHRAVGVEREPADHARARLLVDDLAVHERGEERRELARGSHGELRGVVRPAGAARHVEERRATEAERLGARADGVEADEPEERVGGGRVARRADEGREVGDGQRRHHEVAPEARGAALVVQPAIHEVQRREVARRHARGELDEEEHAAEAGRGQRDVVVDREHDVARVEVGRAGRDPHPIEGEAAERAERGAEAVGRLLPRVARGTAPGVPGAASRILAGRAHRPLIAGRVTRW
ncbi:hypothetical protein CMMCAS03_06900 [Clavibacter michiganensis subsp. michiganensis]|nr:hypothetical protein CMMCAS03_06900 [Clavibacter michiganensis subsp. michiganensis]OUE17498.1 hypothetical protein CMMCA002_15190 [Clavibacter michiganensis subsp. michiganensis]